MTCPVEYVTLVCNPLPHGREVPSGTFEMKARGNFCSHSLGEVLLPPALTSFLKYLIRVWIRGLGALPAFRCFLVDNFSEVTVTK